MLVHKCNFVLQLLLNMNANFAQFYSNQNSPNIIIVLYHNIQLYNSHLIATIYYINVVNP